MMQRLLLLVLGNIFFNSYAQTITPVPPTSERLGYLEYLPPKYSATTQKYPCIIFLHGAGEIGCGLEPDIWKVALHGPFKEIRVNKHTMCFTVNGKQECFIVIGPQVESTVGISESQFRNIYSHIINTYRIDPERVYLTGLSMGGEGAYRRAGDLSNSPNVIAALGIMSATIGCGTAQNVGSKDIPIWAHHGDKDNTFHSYAKADATMDCINSVNPNPPPIFTVYPNVDHSAWNQGYATDHTYNNPNAYEWFLRYRLNRNVTVNLGPDKSITLPINSITLTSTITSTNPIQTFAWTKQSGPSASMVNPSTSILTANNLVEGTYLFRLTVNDSKGNQAFAEVTVKVQKINTKPSVNAGPDKTIQLPTNTVILAGTASDKDGSIVKYNWIKQSGPAATLQNIYTSNLTVTNLLQGTYVFRLWVKDNDSTAVWDEVTLTVQKTNITPSVNAGPDKTIQLPTNTVVLSGSASDQDGSIEKYHWIQQSGPTVTLQDKYEATQTLTILLQGTYVFRLWAKDNDGAAAWDEVTLTVQKTNITPSVNAGPDKTIQLPTNTVVLSGSASDQDGSIEKYHWIQQSGPTVTLQDKYEATQTLTNLLQGTYVFRLWAKDNDGAAAWDEVTLSVLSQTISGINNRIGFNIEEIHELALSQSNSLLRKSETIENTLFDSNLLLSPKTYPNPVRDKLIIEISSELFKINKALNFKLIDLMGNTLIEKVFDHSGMMSIDVSRLQNNTYVYFISSNDKVLFRNKLVKLSN
jgi:hypothetical protein